MGIPDVGDIVIPSNGEKNHLGKPYTFRVDSWLKPYVPSPPETEEDIMMFEILGLEYGNLVEGKAVHCVREEATHVSVAGVCGGIHAISEVTVVGRVSWSEERIEELRSSALRAVERCHPFDFNWEGTA